MLRTGWSEDVLAGTSPGTVANLRHGLYAEALRDLVRVDIAHELQELSDARVTDPKASERLRTRRLSEAEERFHKLRPVQAAAREVLYLDDPEPIPKDAES